MTPSPAPAPPILGFAFYVVGTGCLALGLAELGTFTGNVHAIALAPLPAWAFAIGQAMVLLGLAIAWRATHGASRRLLGVAATLWLTLFVVELQEGRFTAYLAAPASSRVLFASTTASLVGRAIVLLVVAVVAHRTGRAFASRTWMTTLGATLVFADAWAGAWAVVTRASFGHDAARLVYVTPTMIAAGAGLLLAACGLYATGRAMLAGAADDPENARAARSAATFAPPILSIEAIAAIAGLALAHAVAVAIATHVSISKRDVSDTATLGGELAAWIALVVSLRRLRRGASGFAFAVLVALLLEATLRYVVWSHGALSPSSVASLASTLLPFVSGIGVLLMVRALRAAATTVGAWASEHGASETARGPLVTRLRWAANLLAASLAASLFAADVSSSPIYFALQALAVLSGALALIVMIAAAEAGRRIEMAPDP